MIIVLFVKFVAKWLIVVILL